METRTIGGKTIEEVFRKLREEIPGAIRYTEGKDQPYLDMETLRKHFDSHIPVQNYDFCVSDMQYVIAEKATCYVCTASITVYDDDGQKVVTKSCSGAADCSRSKTTGEIIDLAMASKTATVNARKGCMELFGCGKEQLEHAKAAKKAEKKNGSAGNQSRTSTDRKSNREKANRPQFGTGTFWLSYTNGPIKNWPKMILIPVKFLEFQNCETVLLIWKNKFSNCESIVDFIRNVPRFQCNGKFEPYGDNMNRILFESFQEGTGA